MIQADVTEHQNLNFCLLDPESDTSTLSYTPPLNFLFFSLSSPACLSNEYKNEKDIFWKKNITSGKIFGVTT